MKWIRANEVTPISDTYFKIGGLHEDIDYEFRVAAENRAGIGPYSEVSSPVKTYVHKGLYIFHNPGVLWLFFVVVFN